MGRVARIGLAVVVALAMAFCVGSYALDRYLLGQTYARYAPEGPSLALTDSEIAAEYPFTDVSFTMDGYTLRGHVYGDAPDARGLVVLRHGIFSQHQDYLAYITALVDRKWKVFAYDAIGCGESDGDSTLGFAQSPLDVHAAVQFARESGMAGELPVLLFGHSWGGYGVAGALDFDDGVAGCVTMSGFDTPTGITIASSAASMGPIAYTQAPVIDLINWLDFGADGNRSAAQAISKSDVPVLVVHGTGDEVVGFGTSAIIAQRDAIANPNVTYLVKDEPGRDGHNSYFYSPESQSYLDECAEKVYALMDEREGDSVPDADLDALIATFDKKRANTADPELVDAIDAFFADCIA